jgi:hypothetical protein
MNSLFKKLRLVNQSPILVLKAPKEFNELMNYYTGQVDSIIVGKYYYIQVFAEKLDDAIKNADLLISSLNDDVVLWVCYPKRTSTKYKTDIDRNKIWDLFADYEYEPVSQISIDDDWSAVRFRNVDYIKTLTRKNPATKKAKEESQKNFSLYINI